MKRIGVLMSVVILLVAAVAFAKQEGEFWAALP